MKNKYHVRKRTVCNIVTLPCLYCDIAMSVVNCLSLSFSFSTFQLVLFHRFYWRKRHHLSRVLYSSASVFPKLRKPPCFSSHRHCFHVNFLQYFIVIIQMSYFFVNVTLFFLGRWGTHTTYSVNRYFSLLIVYPAGFDSGAWLPKLPIFGDLKIRFMLFMSYDRTFSP